MGKQEELLNIKSEWAGSKIPGLTVKAPVGVGKVKESKGEGTGETEGEKQEEMEAIRRWEEALLKGMKRIPYVDERVEGDDGGEGRRKRRKKEERVVKGEKDQKVRSMSGTRHRQDRGQR